MPKEIERKFLVDGNLFRRFCRSKGASITQAYLKLEDARNHIVLDLASSHPSVTLRYDASEEKHGHKFRFDFEKSKDAQELAQAFAPILAASPAEPQRFGFLPWQENTAEKKAPRFEIRVRIQDDKAFLTFKRKNATPLDRDEIEIPIPRHEAKEMLKAFPTSSLTKTRHEVRAADGKKWDVDQYHGPHEGLVVAEIELKHAEQPFVRPIWAVHEITGERQYGNHHLAKSPVTPARSIGLG